MLCSKDRRPDSTLARPQYDHSLLHNNFNGWINGLFKGLKLIVSSQIIAIVLTVPDYGFPGNMFTVAANCCYRIFKVTIENTIHKIVTIQNLVTILLSLYPNF
jgi:hypothetical protein